MLDQQEAAEAAYCDMESVPPSTPWCSTGGSPVMHFDAPLMAGLLLACSLLEHMSGC